MSETNIIVLAVSALLALAIIGFTIIGSIAFYRAQKGHAVSFGLLFQRGNFLRLSTVVLVVLAVIFLALVEKLTVGAAAVLSGVAGYVLGGMDRLQNGSSDEEYPS